MSKVMGIYVKFTKTAHQIWSRHVILASNSKNFIFFLILYKMLGKLPNLGGIGSKTKKLQAKNKLGWKRPPPPSAYRVNKRLLYLI